MGGGTEPSQKPLKSVVTAQWPTVGSAAPVSTQRTARAAGGRVPAPPGTRPPSCARPRSADVKSSPRTKNIDAEGSAANQPHFSCRAYVRPAWDDYGEVPPGAAASDAGRKAGGADAAQPQVPWASRSHFSQRAHLV